VLQSNAARPTGRHHFFCVVDIAFPRDVPAQPPDYTGFAPLAGSLDTEIV